MIKVGFIYRFRNPDYFSIERVFEEISGKLKGKIFLKEWFAPLQKVSLAGVFGNLKYFKKCKADLYHITGDIHYAAFAFPSGKVILTIHDCIFLQHPSPLKRYLLKKLWLDWPVRYSRVVTTISEATKKDIVSSSGCSPDKVVVIPDPLDNRFSYYPSTFNSIRPVILQVGTWPNKNLERVIPALRDISCHLYIVGKLSEAQLNLLKENSIDYTNVYQVPQTELIDIYRKTDLVIFATTFEGFGLPILEAQSTGRPLITSDLSPMKEVAGKGACLVDPLDISSISGAVKKIIRDESFRNMLVEEGLVNIQRFKPDVIANQYLALYEEVTKHKEG
jgi:glycosyltransferase involved in cell wall biosynthesis